MNIWSPEKQYTNFYQGLERGYTELNLVFPPAGLGRIVVPCFTTAFHFEIESHRPPKLKAFSKFEIFRFTWDATVTFKIMSLLLGPLLLEEAQTSHLSLAISEIQLPIVSLSGQKICTF